MKANLAFVIVPVAAAGVLAYLWYSTDKQASLDRATSTQSIERLSNSVEQLKTDLSESRAVSATLRSNLDERTLEASVFSNRVVVARDELAAMTAQRDAAESRAKSDADSARRQISDRDEQIKGLEGEKENLTAKLSALNRQIGELDTQIAGYRRQLAESEGDRAVLLTHLRELQGQKAELERKFQDLDFLREQYRKRREEAAIAKRVEFRQKGVFGLERKGAQLLQSGIRAPGRTDTNAPARDLKVEIDTSGGARVVNPDKPNPTPKP